MDSPSNVGLQYHGRAVACGDAELVAATAERWASLFAGLRAARNPFTEVDWQMVLQRCPELGPVIDPLLSAVLHQRPGGQDDAGV